MSTRYHTNLVLADGTEIAPTQFLSEDSWTKQKTLAKKEEKQEDEDEMEQYVQEAATPVSIQRTIVDLPAPPQQATFVLVVCAYSLYGLPASDIAEILECTVEQIEQVKDSDTYGKLEKDLVDSVISMDSDSIRGVIQKGAREAANKMYSFLHSKNKQMAFAASRDILDRSGFRPIDVVEHKHNMEGGLSIEIIKRDETKVPTIEIGVPDGDC